MSMRQVSPDAFNDKKHPGFMVIERVLILPDKKLYT